MGGGGAAALPASALPPTLPARPSLPPRRLAERQTAGGGLNGRPQKLPDVCYSWWCLSALALLGRTHWLDRDALAHFILACQDPVAGGISDRPDDAADVYHTFFGGAGLSLLGWGREQGGGGEGEGGGVGDRGAGGAGGEGGTKPPPPRPLLAPIHPTYALTHAALARTAVGGKQGGGEGAVACERA